MGNNTSMHHKGSCTLLSRRYLGLNLSDSTVWLYSGGIIVKVKGHKHLYFYALHIIMPPVAGWVSWEADPEMEFGRPDIH